MANEKSEMESMILVPIFVESRYKVNRKKIKEKVEGIIKNHGITRPVEVSVAIVGNRKIKELNKKYRGILEPTDVLSFSQVEGEGIVSSNTLILGDVVISYPFVIKEAVREEKLVDDKICELVEHGLKHLLVEEHG